VVLQVQTPHGNPAVARLQLGAGTPYAGGEPRGDTRVEERAIGAGIMLNLEFTAVTLEKDTKHKLPELTRQGPKRTWLECSLAHTGRWIRTRLSQRSSKRSWRRYQDIARILH
jgi:hypothetical protein